MAARSLLTRGPPSAEPSEAYAKSVPVGKRTARKVQEKVAPRRARTHGVRALLHRLRGRPSNRRLPPTTRQEIAMLLRTTYVGFNDVHLTEKLQEVHRLLVNPRKSNWSCVTTGGSGTAYARRSAGVQGLRGLAGPGCQGFGWALASWRRGRWGLDGQRT